MMSNPAPQKRVKRHKSAAGKMLWNEGDAAKYPPKGAIDIPNPTPKCVKAVKRFMYGYTMKMRSGIGESMRQKVEITLADPKYSTQPPDRTPMASRIEIRPLGSSRTDVRGL